MDTLKYVELAKSKDETRFNLTSVYRDKNHLVATDGHRLHMSNGLPDAEPHYLNGLDAEFPDYTQVLPKGKEAGKVDYVHYVHIDSDGRRILQALKGIAKLVNMYDRTCPVKLNLENDKPIKLSFQNSAQLELSLDYVLEAFKYQGKPLKLCVNLNYLIDALSYIIDTSCEIKFYGELEPIMIESMGLPSQLTAIVMPQRI